MKKTAVITGATSGIGLATARIFLKHDYAVAALSVDSEEKVNRAMTALTDLGEVKYYPCNIADNSEVSRTCRKIINDFGRIDVLVNNAGIVGKTFDFMDENMLEDTKHVFDVNLIGTLQMSATCAKQMIQQGDGVIINVGSLSGEIVNGVSIGYAASKAAVHMATKVMARDLSQKGIRTVAVAPGCVATELLPDEYKPYVSNLEMKKRPIEPEELAGAIWFMAQPEASAINGSTVMADDGYCSFKM